MNSYKKKGKGTGEKLEQVDEHCNIFWHGILTHLDEQSLPHKPFGPLLCVFAHSPSVMSYTALASYFSAVFQCGHKGKNRKRETFVT